MSSVNHSTVDQKKLIITENHLEHKRIDKILAQEWQDFSRTQIQDFHEQGLITLNGSSHFALNKTPTLGSILVLQVPPPQTYDLLPEDIPLSILYEDEHLLFVNKPAGMCVHPAAGNWYHTLVHALLHHCPNLSGIGNIKRPGIVHRLDKGTSGVMIVAKTQNAHQKLIEIFKAHSLVRKYQALVIKKNIATSGRLESFIDRSTQDRKKMTVTKSRGKKAVTYYRILKAGQKLLLLECQLETGRTHQIRVHSSELLNTPILNDYLYANPKQHLKALGTPVQQLLQDYPYPLLHAQVLGLHHPISGQWLEFSVSPPSPFRELVELLEQNEL